MKGLTRRQEDVLKFIADYLQEYGYPPSYQEIADAFGIASKHGVVRHLEALIKKGHIEKTGTTARSLRILDERYKRCPQISLTCQSLVRYLPVFRFWQKRISVSILLCLAG